VHVELRLFGADAAAGADDAVDDSLDIDAGGDNDAGADDDGKDGVEIDAVTGASAFGVDGAADFEEDFGSRGDQDDVGGCRRCGQGCGRRRCETGVAGAAGGGVAAESGGAVCAAAARVPASRSAERVRR
jgi:hypothetical protein